MRSRKGFVQSRNSLKGMPFDRIRVGVRRCLWCVLSVLIVVLGSPVLISASTGTALLGPGGSFWDDDGTEYEGAIEAAVASGLMSGCNSPYYDMFCPDREMTRAEAAVVFAKMLGLEGEASIQLSDTKNVFGGDASRLVAGGGLMVPCDISAGLFCPHEPFSRRDMELFLLVVSSRFEADIAGGSLGSRYAVSARIDSAQRSLREGNSKDAPNVNRGEMAHLIGEVLGITPIVPPPASHHLISRFTIRYTCCSPRDAAAHAAARGLDKAVVLPREVFSMNNRLGTVEHGFCRTATSLFNAVYWAGLAPVERYLDGVNYTMYPDGLEAILVMDKHDFRFRNDFDRPIEIRTSTTSTSVTIEIWGDNDGRSVDAEYFYKTGYLVSVLDEGGPRAVKATVDVEKTAPREFQVTRRVHLGGAVFTEVSISRYRTGT